MSVSGQKPVPTKPTKNKSMSSFRVTPEAKDLLIQLAALQGISQSAVLEILIRQEACNLGYGFYYRTNKELQ